MTLTILGGHKAIDLVDQRATEAKALKCTRLFVSGAFHTSHMATASAALQEALVDVEVMGRDCMPI